MNPQLQLMLQQAIKAFQDGHFDRADSALKRILQVDTKNLPALHVLGLIKASQANYAEATDLLGRAARINPNDASIQYNLAKAFSDCGLNKESMPHHKKAVQLAVNNPEAWLNYGKSASSLGRYDEALDCYSKSLSLNPNFAEAALNKGITLNQLQRYEEAIVFAERALEINPNLMEAWSNKGIALRQLKHYDEAIEHYDKALSLKPEYSEAFFNKGAILHELKHLDKAIECFDKVLSSSSVYAQALSDKGIVLCKLKRFDEALICFDKVLVLKPDYAEGWSSKGNALHELNRDDEALIQYDKALSLRSDYAEGWSNKGVVLNGLKRFEEAAAHYDRALSLKPDIDWLYGHSLHTKMKIANWSGLAEALQDISNGVIARERVIQPFALLALSDDAFLHQQSSEVYAQSNYPLNDVLGPILKRPKSQRIRIAYFSADFNNHAVSFLTAELFELHNKNRFETIAFSFGADDKKLMRLRLSQAFSQFIEVSHMSDLEIAKLSRELCVDIAVDLGGYTTNSRAGIFAYRAAPIQVGYVGYLGTMGAEYFDYLLSDKTIIPEDSQKFYSEKIAYLPSYQVNDRKRAISDGQFTRRELGLPEDGFVFCCFNNSYKIMPATFDGWMRILKVVDGSVLFLYADNEQLKTNLINEAKVRGVNGARLVFGGQISTEDYLARYKVCNLFLDTFPYNAGTTASDALWAGLPVLTFVGRSFASRVAASVLNAIGLPELITKTQEEYEALAIELAKNPKKLKDIQLKLANNRLSTPLFDTPLFTNNIEAAFIKMMERYWGDLPPEHIFI